MPSFDVDFEVFCATCNSGLCNNSDTRKSRNRQELQLLVEACPYCMGKKDDEISYLKSEIEELENKIKTLEI